MTALRQEPVDIVELVPEDKIFSLLQYIRETKSLEQNIQNFKERLAKKYELKDNAEEIQSSIDFIKNLHSQMDKSLTSRTDEQWREERLKDKYAEHFN
ncbi:MAG: hypothetical protein IJG33_08200 [Selenomonadaceae bacterium]|nr:hypothetical protein [Selenomonadaceae bacterium]